MRTLRAEVRAEMAALRGFVGTRAEETETFMDTRFDALMARLDQTERSIHERLEHIERQGRRA